MYINKKDLTNEYKKIIELKTRESVSAVLDCYEDTIKDVGVGFVFDLVQYCNGYVCVVGDNDQECSFDLYAFINSLWDGDVIVSCVNARYLFPRGTVVVSDDDDEEDDVATGYMDSEPEVQEHMLVHDRTGIKLPITSDGLIIGRSSKQSGYVVHGNNNVSRMHVRIYKKNGGCFVHNYEPPNGTFINGGKLRPNADYRLPNGCVLTLADESFSLE